MRANLSRAFTVALALVFAAALFDAQDFRAQARLFPTVIAVAGLALAIVHLVVEFRRPRAATVVGDGLPASVEAVAEATAAAEAAGVEAVPPAVRQRRTLAILGWVLGFALAVWLIGFPLSVPLLTFAYLKLAAGESGRLSVIFALAAGLVFYVLFIEIIHIPFEPGMLTDLLPT